MKLLSELFWNASVEELKQGYTEDKLAEVFVCLACGEQFEQGRIYEMDQGLYEAGKAVKKHVVKEHTSMFDYLISLDKKYTGLTDLQKELVVAFRRGLSDKEIVSEQGGNASTIRNHRFTLREKVKQARIFQAIMELSETKVETQSPFIPIHQTATMLDDRYALTEEEAAQIVHKYFSEPDEDGEETLSEFPRKEKRKIAIMQHVMKRFDLRRRYTEKEVNEVLRKVHDQEYVTLRRYLVDYGFLDRLEDGREYWVKSK